MKHHPFRIIPLGGLGEVGKNMMAYEYAGEYLIVDSGMMFPNNDMLGVDYIIPDFSWLLNKRQQVRGIVITHGHEDHIGSIQHLLAEIQAPIYATPLTRGLLEVKLARHGMLQKTELVPVNAGAVVKIGPFQVELFHVCHSIPDGVGLGIQTPAGLVVHSGDYKFDHTPVDNWPSDYAKLAEFSRRGVMALLADSTNAERAGWTPSERLIDSAFDQVFSHARGRIIVASFASLVSRMQQVANAATRHNRRIAFAGTSMVDNVKMARRLGYLEIPEKTLVPLDQALNLPDPQVVIMCTGSQGEPTSILGRLSTGRYRGFDVKAGDTVMLSSHPIPGNEEDVYRTINRLFQRGAEVIYEAIAPVHVSGHASQEEIKMLLNLVKPKYVIPIHGELRHLKQHAVLAQQVGIPPENITVTENGQIIEFREGRMELGERVPGGYVFVDGASVGDIDRDVMREREQLSDDGALVVSLAVDAATGHLRSAPVVTSQGFLLEREAGEVLEQVRSAVAQALAATSGDPQVEVQQAVRRYLYNELHRSPVIFVAINKV